MRCLSLSPHMDQSERKKKQFRKRHSRWPATIAATPSSLNPTTGSIRRSIRPSLAINWAFLFFSFFRWKRQMMFNEKNLKKKQKKFEKFRPKSRGHSDDVITASSGSSLILSTFPPHFAPFDSKKNRQKVTWRHATPSDWPALISGYGRPICCSFHHTPHTHTLHTDTLETHKKKIKKKKKQKTNAERATPTHATPNN